MLKISIVLILSTVFASYAGNIWIETTQSDFADGIFERNIYSSHRNEGALEFAPRFDLNNDGYIDLITCDIGGPYVTIHWGDELASYSSETNLPATGAGNCDMADINIDGYTDFIVSHSNSDCRLAIYWGSASGPSPDNVFNIPNSPSVPNEVSYVVDLNKDGYLDIIIAAYYSLHTGAIFWGSANGYSASNRTELPTVFGAYNTEVADLNSDGWYDIIYVNNSSSGNYIYWGSATGYSTNNMTSLPAPQSTPHGSSVADLNDDGFLDLIFTSVYGSQSYIYYGCSNGYQSYQILETNSTYGGSAVYDVNYDGHLDIIFFRGWPGALKPIVYWGSATGYSDVRRAEIGTPANGSGGFVGDFNGDGYGDIFVNSRSSESPIFWGPDYNSSTLISVNRDHHGMFREIGNVYNREYYEDYISSVFDAGETANWGTIEWDASSPSGAEILFWARSRNATTPDQIHAEPWSDWVHVFNGGAIPEILNARYLQYKARLAYVNPCYLPMLNEVCITYAPQTVSSGDISISCSPNPFTNKADIALSSNINSNNSIKVYDISGSLIRTLKITGNNTENSVTWDRKDRFGRIAPAGIYFLRIQNNKETVTEKVVILD